MRRRRKYLPVRTVIAATHEGSIGGQDDDKVIDYPVVILDDGSAFRLNGAGEWRPLRPIPGTAAAIAYQKAVDAMPPITDE